MAIQIMPREPKSTIDSLLGSLGTGLGEGVENILQHKINQVNKRQQQQQFAQKFSGLGVQKEHADFLSSLDPEILKTILPDYLAGLTDQSQQQEPGSIADRIGMQQQQQPKQRGFGNIVQEGRIAKRGVSGTSQNLSPLERTKQTQLEKFEAEKLKEFDNYNNIADQAQDMLDILNQYEEQFPQNWATQNAPDILQKFIIGNKAAEYKAKAIDLARASSLVKGGRGSNYTAQLDQAAKADLSKPIKTQKALLESIIKKSNKRATGPEYMASLRDQITGLLPNDFKEKVAAFERKPKSIAQSQINNVPAELPPIQNVKPGKAYVVDTEIWYVDPKTGQWDHIPATPEQLAQNQGA